MSEPDLFQSIHCANISLRSVDTQKYTLLGLLTETVFSLSSSVAAFQNTCNACK